MSGDIGDIIVAQTTTLADRIAREVCVALRARADLRIQFSNNGTLVDEDASWRGLEREIAQDVDAILCADGKAAGHDFLDNLVVDRAIEHRHFGDADRMSADCSSLALQRARHEVGV